jgi:gamma-glutamylaminecyclotransferase
MCIILIKQRNNVVPMGTLKNCARINRHGLGVVWLDTFEVTKHKSNEYKILNTDRPFIAHFRLATIGVVDKSNVHPFTCGKNQNELLMMNGTIHGLGNLKVCDTKVLARSLGKIPRQLWKQHLAKHQCRFVTINKHTRTFQMYNKNLWTKHDDVWYSKTNVLRDNLMAVYGTLKKGYSNSYLLHDASFVGSGVTADKYPMVSNGIPFVIEDKGVGYNIKVEVYRVNADTLANIDRLEGHPNWYERKQVKIHCKGKVYMCWLYFNNKHNYKGQTLLETYEQKIPTIDYLDDFEDVDTPRFSFDDDLPIEHESPICQSCYQDLIHDDTIDNYYCEQCLKWYTAKDVEQFKL